MQPIPQPVRNVSVYPYLPSQPIVVPPVFVNGAGTYSVGTLTTNIFYNLDLSSGVPQHGGVVAGSKYYATCESADGKPFRTTWMTCLQGGAKRRALAGPSRCCTTRRTRLRHRISPIRST